MKLETAFEDVPHDDDLLYSIEHWDRDDIEASDGMHSDSEAEAFVHPRTATAVRIMGGSDGTYSVQPSMGDYGVGDCVVQSDDPNSFVSGGKSVVMTEVETLSEARAIAYTWMRGWVMRNGSIGESEGDVRDAEHNSLATPIE